MNKLIQISSGKGPLECELAVGKYLQVFLAEVKGCTIKSFVKGSSENCYKSVVLSVPGDVIILEGSIKWIAQSPFRPKHKRKNWFIEVCPFSEEPVIECDDQLVRFETFHCGGKGGQNVNKVESGVRAIHIPTGLCVASTTERTQYLNKKAALERLMSILNTRNENSKTMLKESMRLQHEFITRGNPIRVYEGMDFKRVK